jgi:hypothetical protein
MEARLPAGLNEHDQGQDVEPLQLRPVVRQTIAGRVEDTDTVNQVLVVPHDGALVADPGWQRLSALPPFPDDVGAWRWDAERGIIGSERLKSRQPSRVPHSPIATSTPWVGR